MCKLLIADDEQLICEGIALKLAKQGYVFEWIGYASDGEEALSLILANRPDLVITDINMPFLNGVNLIGQCVRQGLRTRFLIVTGHAEFEYAKQALEYGVVGYIMKPIQDGQLLQAVNKALGFIEQDGQVDRLRTQLNQSERTTAQLELERVVNRLFHLPIHSISGQDMPDLAHLFSTDMTCFTVMLIHLGTFSAASPIIHDENVREEVRNSVGHLLGEAGFAIHDLTNRTQIIAVVGGPDESTLDKLITELGGKILNTLTVEFDIAATISLSDQTKTLTTAFYRQAQMALLLRLVRKDTLLFHHKDEEACATRSYPTSLLKALESAVCMHDVTAIALLLHELFQPPQERTLKGADLRNLFSDIIHILARNTAQDPLAPEVLIDAESNQEELLGCFQTIEDMIRYLHSMLMDAMRVASPVPAQCRELIDDIKAFIGQNYQKDLQVKDLACRFSIHPNYLSTLFRQEEGVTLSAYITDVCIQKACSLLRETDLSISTIAQSVGYQDPQYFSKVFRKATGMTAMEFRNT